MVRRAQGTRVRLSRGIVLRTRWRADCAHRRDSQRTPRLLDARAGDRCLQGQSVHSNDSAHTSHRTGRRVGSSVSRFEADGRGFGRDTRNSCENPQRPRHPEKIRRRRHRRRLPARQAGARSVFGSGSETRGRAAQVSRVRRHDGRRGRRQSRRDAMGPRPSMNDEQLTLLLQDLVRIPSVNPDGNPGTDLRNTGEARMVEFLADFCRKLALDVEIQEVEPGRANLIAKFSSRGGKHSVALAPHTDTVSVAGMTIDPFCGDVRNGKLYGRGATDTKGSIAAFLTGLANAVRQKSFREGDLNVYFCALMGEEGGSQGARALMQRGFKADFAIAGEPTGCRVVYTHKGAIAFKVITRGKSAHSSMPERGENAIQKMAGVVDFLLGEYADTLKLIKDEALGSPTINVGIIRGGTQTNIVPNYCEIEVDRRTVPGENPEEILRHLRQ